MKNVAAVGITGGMRVTVDVVCMERDMVTEDGF
jgi:hypothetical protein